MSGSDAAVVALVERLHQETMKSLHQLSQTLHTKVDKLVRQVDDVVEQQKKITKAVAAMGKAKAPALPASNGEAEPNSESKTLVVPPSVQKDEPVPIGAPPPSGGFNHWSKNLLLIGDEQWNCLQQVEDIASDLKSWEKQYGLILISKPDETLSRLYDAKRGKMLFALPPRVSKVAVSVGEEDLRDKRLLTLQIASLEEVRKQNREILLEKANAMKAMVDYLLKLNKTVVVTLPPQRDERTEILKQWEEVVLEQLAPLRSSRFKIINLPKEMRSSMSSFDSPEEYTNTWFSPAKGSSDKRNLSPYGARRLLDLLQRSFISRVPDKPGQGCPRCTRVHPGGEESCKSRDKMCRKCNRVGHFQEIHDVTDRSFQDIILRTLGGQITFNGEIRFFVEPSTAAEAEEPEVKRARLLPDHGRAGPVSAANPNMEPLGNRLVAARPPSFDDWYSGK